MTAESATTPPTHQIKPKVRFGQGPRFQWIKKQARRHDLHTVCEEARCPNIGECWQEGTATFMLMGDTCTRGCRFCAVATARNPQALDNTEPVNIANTIHAMQLSYVVLTSVNRDDLADQGANHFAETIRRTRLATPDLLVEVLIPDFRGDKQALQTVLEAKPHVLAHNVETVERLTPKVRDPRARYEQSLSLLKMAKVLTPQVKTKSSLMLGLGEQEAEVQQTMADLRQAGVDFLTLGQYLQPTSRKLKVVEYLTQEHFDAYQKMGLELGFLYVASGPLVRSSYRAGEFYIANQIRQDSGSN